MRKILLPLALMLLAGCSSSDDTSCGDITGTWEITAELEKESPAGCYGPKTTSLVYSFSDNGDGTGRMVQQGVEGAAKFKLSQCTATIATSVEYRDDGGRGEFVGKAISQYSIDFAQDRLEGFWSLDMTVSNYGAELGYPSCSATFNLTGKRRLFGIERAALPRSRGGRWISPREPSRSSEAPCQPHT